MLLRILIFLSVLLSFSANAGKITVEKGDSLIRNELFDEKWERAAEYKRREDERKLNNEAWLYRLAPECALLRAHYLIYRCSDGEYYKAYEAQDGLHYRKLSEKEVKKLHQKSE